MVHGGDSMEITFGVGSSPWGILGVYKKAVESPLTEG